MKIEWLISGSASQWVEQNYENGGYVYDTCAREILRESHDVIVTYIYRGRSSSRVKRFVQMGRYILKSKNLKLHGQIVFRDLYSTVFAPFEKGRKNVVILHHFDTSGFGKRAFYHFFKKSFFKRILLADAVIVVSEYWKDILEKNGCRNVVIIHNSFDLTQFEFDQEELEDFRHQLGLSGDRLIIYLGNARPEKGYKRSYEVLKDLDAVFVTTGRGNIDLPILHKYLSYRDYLKLLKLSTLVITMSTFNEGWCRTAHEAMLCGTPVIGSGKGGMRELLERGGQIVCTDSSKLASIVTDLLSEKQRLSNMASAGRKYASQFTLDKFRQSWIDIMSSLGN